MVFVLADPIDNFSEIDNKSSEETYLMRIEVWVVDDNCVCSLRPIEE